MRKRIISLLMAFVLVCSCCFVATTAQADDTAGGVQVTLTGTDGWSTCVDGDNWVLYLTTSGYSSTDWTKKYAGFTYEIDGVTGTTSQVSSAENNRLYCTIPTSAVPATDGTTFTIKAGTYAAEGGTSESLNIANDFTVVASESRLVHTKVVKPAAVEAFNGTANAFYFSLKDGNGTGIATGVESWTNFLSPSWCDGTRITQDAVPNQWSTVYSGVFINGSPMNYWDAHFKNTGAGEFYIDGLNAVAGTKVVVKGHFVSSKQSDWSMNGNFYLPKLEFEYDGSAWNYIDPITTTNVTLTNTDGWSTCVDGDKWVLYLTTSGYNSTDDSRKYEGFKYEINGVEGTTSQVCSASANRLYCTIPTSVVPATDGTVFTIKAGTYTGVNGTSERLNITDDFTIVASESRLVHTKVVEPTMVEAFNGTANAFYFSLKDGNGTAIATGVENWNNFLSPSWCDGTRITQDTVPNQWSTVYSGVFINGSPINYWDAHFKNTGAGEFYIDGLNAVAGTKVVVKGHFVSSKQSDWSMDGNFYLPKLEFEYDGSAWSYVQPTSGGSTQVQTVSFNFIDLLTISKYNATSGKWEIYLSTTKALPGTEEVTTFDIQMNVGGQEQTITCKKSSQQQAFAFEIDGSVIPENPTEEIALTIKAGTYDVSGEETKLTIENDKTLYFANGIVDLVSSNIDADEKDITFTLDRTNQAGGTVAGIYLTATDNVPYDTTWATNSTAYDGKANGVFLNGVKTDVFLKKYDTNKYYVCLSDVNVVPQEGDIVTIKGAFKTNDYISSYKEYTVTFKDGSWVDGTEPETNYTTVTIMGYDSSVSKYNEALNRWELYFTTEEKLPGNPDQRFETVQVDINGKVYDMPCYHGSHRDEFFLIIENDKLPKIVNDDEVKVTVSGKAKSEDLLIGMDVQEFALYVNKYGLSLEGYASPIAVKEKDVKLTLDTVTFGWTAGNESGINLYTSDKFAVDNTWQTPIRAIGYDENSGIFYNGKKIDGYLKKHVDGLIYLDIAAAGVFAKDKDSVTIKGTFALDGYGVSYAEQTFYYNGQSWGTTYTEPIKKTTTTLNPIGIVKPSNFNPERKAWDIYVQVDGAIPGGHDYEYKTFIYEVNGKTYETSVYRVDDKLVFFVPETIVPQDAKDGTAITLKAGTASDNYGIYDIVLTKDATAYVYRKSISGTKPTENTKYLDITIPGLIRTWTFNKDIKEWQLFFIVEEDFDVEDGTRYYDLPVKLNGKSYEEINVFRSGACLYISIPESVLPSNTKSATLTIGKGAKAVANAGWNGIRLKNEVNAYMFDCVWNNVQFTKAEVTDLTIKHMNFCSYNADAKRWDIYVNVDKELPGTAWFEYYDGLTAYLNGKEFTTYANKAESENNRLLYISLDEATFGKFKDGDILYIPGDVTWNCGGYKLNNTRDFYLQYVNGIWMEYYESNVKAPEALNSIWEKFRIDGYIPVQEEKGIMFSNVAPTNVIKSVEDMKDVTFTFETTKMMAMNEELPTNSFVLRGQPLSEEMDISETALYGYNVSFSYIELTEANTPNNPELWGTHSQEIAVWKNGINYNLLDQYRMTYNWQKTNHPFFEYNETYKYTVSIYNVTEDICVIEIYCNDELVMRVVDHASDDPMDPARNAGEFQIYAACPQYFNAPAVELDALEVSASECYIGEQVRVSATYPAILEGAEYTVDGEGATLKDGVFTATKTGTYTVSGKFNGKDKGTVQIKVSEEPKKDVVVEETSTFPIIPVAITGGSVLIIGAILLVLFLKKKKKNS